MNAITPGPPAPVDVGKRIEQYLKLRDKTAEIKKRHKEELKPYNEAMEQLEAMLLRHLIAVGTDSSSTKGVGTVYRTTKRSATIADTAEFRRFVLENNAWDLADLKANAPAVAAFIEEGDGSPPPGVNYSQSTEVGVRRA